MKKTFLLLTVFTIAVFVQAQTMCNPLVGAWQLASIDDAGTVIYRDRLKVYTPSGLLKGIANVKTQDDGCLWLDGSYAQKGDSVQGSFIEHSKWHSEPKFIGVDVEFSYNIANDTLILTYKSFPNIKETWIRVGELSKHELLLINQDEHIEETPNKVSQKAEKEYLRDKEKYSNKPFALAGLWKRGSSLKLNMHLANHLISSYKSLRKSLEAEVDFDRSSGSYVLLCEDGFVFFPDSPFTPLPKIANENGADEDLTVEQHEKGYCEQLSVLSPNELGRDDWFGREIYYPLFDDLYQVVLCNSMGNLMAADYYWKPEIEKNINIMQKSPILNWIKQGKGIRYQ